MVSIIESGVELFARLTVRPNLDNFCSKLFENNDQFTSEIIEINGDSLSGKTSLLMEFIIHTIFPKEYKNIEFGGCEASAILIDSDHHFDILRLITIGDNKIRQIFKENHLEVEKTDVDMIIQDSLKRLIILNVFNLLQLQCTILKVGSLVHENTNIALVCLDSISSFYWLKKDFIQNKLSKDQYKNEILKLVYEQINDYKITFVYTKSKTFLSKQKSDSSKKLKLNSNYEIQLEVFDSHENLYLAKFLYKQDIQHVKKCILKNGWQIIE